MNNFSTKCCGEMFITAQAGGENVGKIKSNCLDCYRSGHQQELNALPQFMLVPCSAGRSTHRRCFVFSRSGILIKTQSGPVQLIWIAKWKAAWGETRSHTCYLERVRYRVCVLMCNEREGEKVCFWGLQRLTSLSEKGVCVGKMASSAESGIVRLVRQKVCHF